MADAQADRCIEALTRVAETLHLPAATAAVLEAVATVVDYDLGMILVYREGAAPISLCDTLGDDSARQALNRYITRTYILNPVYTAFCKGLAPGVHRIRDLAPDAYFLSEHYHGLEVHLQSDEELGYRTRGWPRGMEEVLCAVDLGEGAMAEISLSRAMVKGGFGDGTLTDLRRIAPLVSALMRQHWHLVRDRLQGTPVVAVSIDRLLKTFGADRLSPREREVVHLVLKGHSSESIGDLLKITVATVKTHRHNIYEKLQISTQQELFFLFMRALEIA
jgi:DNA-binding CsgD family transcriptional regulator